MKEAEWWLTEEDVSKLEKAVDVAKSDLKQLPEVDDEQEKMLKGQGYITLWEVAFEDCDAFAVAAGATKNTAEKIVATANEPRGLEEEEES